MSRASLVNVDTLAQDLPVDAKELTAMFPHVRLTLVQTLAAAARGERMYAPQTTSHGTPVRCQIEYCRNTALAAARKRRCPYCYLRYLERSNKGVAQRTAWEALTAERDRLDAAETEQRQLDAENERAAQFQHKYDTLAAATTVDDLRAWIQEHVLTN